MSGAGQGGGGEASLPHHILSFVFPQVELAEICTKSERYIGTEGGGMDQSICFLAEKGTVRAT